MYRAGNTPNVDDQVTVTDSLGNTGSATISVGEGLTLTPKEATLAPAGMLQFTAQGGSGNGIRFVLAVNASGGEIDPDTGAYVAGTTPNVTDQVLVTDDVGNQANALVHVGAGLVLDPPAVTVRPRTMIAFNASGGGGGYTFTLRQNGSGATIASTSGAYVAGARAATRDVVEVTDRLGTSASAMVTVDMALTVTATSPQVAPGGTATFVANGGSGSGYTFTLTMNGSGATIDAKTGAYTAGATDAVDTVTVTDSAGNTAVVNVAVGNGLALNPGGPAVAPGETVTFVATGGSGTGYTFAVSSNTSSATIDASSGRYVAGNQGNVTDTVTVTDSGGRTASVAVKVGRGLTLTPPESTVAPATRIRFLVAGGSGTGNVFAVPTNASHAVIDVGGNYRAGLLGKVTDTVTVVDSLGSKASATVTVGEALKVTPTTATVPPRGSLELLASGGAGDYAFTLSESRSGGTVNHSSGAYRAGKTGSVTDVVTLKDGNAVVTDAVITVGPPVTVTPATSSVASRATVQLKATGGSGNGYVWTITKNGSGSTIDGTGIYTAGTVDTGAKADSIEVTDSLGNTATASIEVVRARNVTIGGGSGCDCTVGSGAEPSGALPVLGVLALLTLVVAGRRTRSRRG